MISIVTDSTSDLPVEEQKRHDITVVPESVIFGRTSYQDGIDLTPEQFYAMLPKAQDHPTTSQPSAGDFIKRYQPLLQAGKEIVSIHLSSKLSGTYASAVAAKKELEDELKKELPITILETPWITMALGMLCVIAAQAARSGKSRDQVVAAVNAIIPKLNIIFVLDTLEYLKRGGRIGAASALLGTMLNFKPMLTLKDGAVHPLEKPRSRSKAIRRLMEMLEESAKGKGLHVAVLNGDAKDEAAAIGKEICELYGCVEFYSVVLGPAIGAHTGPGTIGLAYYTE